MKMLPVTAKGHTLYDARCIANEFIQRAVDQDRPLTHLQIQKLVYFAHARLLVLHGQPLIDQAFEAWEYGPVVPDLYHALKHTGSEEVLEIIPVEEPPVYSFRETDIFNWCFKQYGCLSGPRLTTLTHAGDSPWSEAAARDQTLISNDDIAHYHALEWESDSLAEVERIASMPSIQRDVRESIEAMERGEYVSYTLAELEQKTASHDTRSA